MRVCQIEFMDAMSSATPSNAMHSDSAVYHGVGIERGVEFHPSPPSLPPQSVSSHTPTTPFPVSAAVALDELNVDPLLVNSEAFAQAFAHAQQVQTQVHQLAAQYGLRVVAVHSARELAEWYMNGGEQLIRHIFLEITRSKVLPEGIARIEPPPSVVQPPPAAPSHVHLVHHSLNPPSNQPPPPPPQQQQQLNQPPVALTPEQMQAYHQMVQQAAIDHHQHLHPSVSSSASLSPDGELRRQEMLRVLEQQLQQQREVHMREQVLLQRQRPQHQQHRAPLLAKRPSQYPASPASADSIPISIKKSKKSSVSSSQITPQQLEQLKALRPASLPVALPVNGLPLVTGVNVHSSAATAAASSSSSSSMGTPGFKVRGPYKKKSSLQTAVHAMTSSSASVQPSQAPPNSYPLDSFAYQVMRLLVLEFKKCDADGWFESPVDRRSYPQYYQMIREPMDLSTIEKRLKDGREYYLYFFEFARDVELISRNCMQFNAEGSDIWKAGNLFGTRSRAQLAAADMMLRNRYVEKPYSPAHAHRLANAHGVKGALTNKQLGNDKVVQKGPGHKGKKMLEISDPTAWKRSDRPPRDSTDLKKKPSSKKGSEKDDESSTSSADKAKSDRDDWDHIVINPYEEICDYVPIVDHDVIVEKLRSSKRGDCQGEHCHDITKLGPFDPGMSDLGGFQSDCSDRRVCLECSDSCTCDSSACQNRAISLQRRKRVGVDVVPRRTYGMDSFTRSRILKAMPPVSVVSAANQQHFIEFHLLPQINQLNPNNMSSFPHGNMLIVLRAILSRAKKRNDLITELISKHLVDALLAQHDKHSESASSSFSSSSSATSSSSSSPPSSSSKPLYEEWPIYPKGMGMVCVAPAGIKANELIAEYYGEVYPPWRWFEKEDVIKQFTQKYGGAPVDDFYNIMLERHKDDAGGYDVLFVDPIRKGNFASRMSHSCNPNCSTVVMSANGRFVIAMYAIRDITFSEELTFDYNSVTESEEEHKDGVCLCGTQFCRGSFIALAAADSYNQVLSAEHEIGQRTRGLLDACIRAEQPLTPDEVQILEVHSIRQSILGGLPLWCIRYVVFLLSFIGRERDQLPEILMRDAKKKASDEENASKKAEKPMDLDTAVLESKGVYHSRLQNLAITMDRVKYSLRQIEAASKLPSSSSLKIEEIDDSMVSDSSPASPSAAAASAPDSMPSSSDAIAAATAAADTLSSSSCSASSEPLCADAEESSSSSSSSASSLASSIPSSSSVLQQSYSSYSTVHSFPSENASCPLRVMSPQEVVDALWNQPDSVISRFVISIKPHLTRDQTRQLQEDTEVRLEGNSNGLKELKHRILKLRDLCRSLKPTSGALHHASADLLHLYAHTNTWFTAHQYATFKSPPLHISELGLAGNPSSSAASSTSQPALASLSHQTSEMESETAPAASPTSSSSASSSLPAGAVDANGFVDGKQYPALYVLSILSFWYKQNMTNPTTTLTHARRGVINLPGPECCYSKNRQSSLQRVYSASARQELLMHLKHKPSHQWAGNSHWTFNGSGNTTKHGRLFGSPMFDALDSSDPEAALARYHKIIDEMNSWRVNYPTD